MIERILPMGLLLDEQGHILMLKRIDRQTREPIKWWVQEGETVEQALYRELKEETWIDSSMITKSVFLWVYDRAHSTEWNTEDILTHVHVYIVWVPWVKPVIAINNDPIWGVDHDDYRRVHSWELELLPIDFKDFFMTIRQSISHEEYTWHPVTHDRQDWKVVIRVIDRDGQDLWLFPASKHESILDTAEKHNIDIGYSCRSGACFACACHVQSGYPHIDIGKFGYPLVDVDEWDCLTCISGINDDAWDWPQKEIIIKKF